jgi:hypothetical protein
MIRTIIVIALMFAIAACAHTRPADEVSARMTPADAKAAAQAPQH